MKKSIFSLWAVALFLFAACTTAEPKNEAPQEAKAKEVNIYSHRHYDIDKELYAQFEKETGIKVNVVKAKAGELIERIKAEGESSTADLFITADAGNLQKAKENGVLMPFESEKITATVASQYRDTDKNWYALTKRARVIAYHKDRVKPGDLSTYEALADKEWKDRILVRSSSNMYNQSLMASLIANDGREGAKNWAEQVVGNMAREPKGNDRDQVYAIAAGEGDLAIINTYYMGLLLNDSDPEKKAAGEQMSLFFPNQDDRGTHINISGVGMVKGAPNKAEAIQLVEFLLSKKAQERFSEANYEYPILEEAAVHPLLASWGAFKEDKLPLYKLGELNKEAVMVFNEAGWK